MATLSALPKKVLLLGGGVLVALAVVAAVQIYRPTHVSALNISQIPIPFLKHGGTLKGTLTDVSSKNITINGHTIAVPITAVTFPSGQKNEVVVSDRIFLVVVPRDLTVPTVAFDSAFKKLATGCLPLHCPCIDPLHHLHLYPALRFALPEFHRI